MEKRYRAARSLWTALLILAFLAGAAVAGADASDQAFRQDRVHKVWLTIPNISWTAVDDEALTACERHERSYYTGTIRFEDAEFPRSGVRIKATPEPVFTIFLTEQPKLISTMAAPAATACCAASAVMVGSAPKS